MVRNMDRFKNMSNKIRRRTTQESGESSKQNEISYLPLPAPMAQQPMPTQSMPQPNYSSLQGPSHHTFASVDTLRSTSGTPWNPMHNGYLPNTSGMYQWSQSQNMTPGFPPAPAPAPVSASTQKNKEPIGIQQNHAQLQYNGSVSNYAPSGLRQELFGNEISPQASQKSKFNPSKILRRNKTESNPSPKVPSPKLNETQYPLQPYTSQPPGSSHTIQPPLGPHNTPKSYFSAIPSFGSGMFSSSNPGKLYPEKGQGVPPIKDLHKYVPPDFWPADVFNYATPNGYDDGYDFFDEYAPLPLHNQASNKYLTNDTPIGDLETLEEENINHEGILLGEDPKSSTDENETSSDAIHMEEDLDEEITEEVKQIQEYAHRVVNVACAACHKKVSLSASDVPKLTKAWCSSTGAVIVGIKCAGTFCNKYICLGCGMNITSEATEEPQGYFQVSGMAFKAYWCCDAGKLAGAWALACGWKAARSPKFPPVANAVEMVRRSHSHGHVKFGPNRPSATAKGVGYGGSDRPDTMKLVHIPSRRNHHHSDKAALAGTKEDLVREAYFRLLTLLLSSRDGMANNERLPLGLLRPMLSRSQLMEQAALLLATDSIEETSRKYHLFDAVLDFVELLGQFLLTSSLVYNKRNIYHERKGSLIKVSFAEGTSTGGLAPKDTGRSLTTLLESLAAQAKSVVKFASTNAKEFEESNMLALSQRIITMSEFHNEQKQLVRTDMEICNDNPVIDLAEWHRENGVMEAPDDNLLSNFTFAQEAHNIANIEPPRGRMKRLITEIATLRTSLPEGIYICHGSSRLDIMKVLIIGPRGTPYEHGFFQFDLLCPVDYPNKPPKMSFKNTGGGRVRFNPNLYEDGKICLSLLGTWSGEPWVANQSTILQVLVSIQSMILCQEPWYNEPGREMTKSNSMSTRYSNQVRSHTIDIAIRPWINVLHAHNTEPATAPITHSSKIWEETVRLYLKANAKEIYKAYGDAAGQSQNNNLQSSWSDLKESLRNQGYLDQSNDDQHDQPQPGPKFRTKAGSF
ncbi:hypothetical protein F4810DRAFT_459498 [Camillea tinctor]|nr:hypothetical protein F4810DRAFT_459498 [Camillea tinctor]